MGITIVEQLYDKKKNKFSVNFKYNFRVNFVKSVMFFQNKIKSEALNETTKVYKSIVEPMITEYLANYQDQFKRPAPKIKKKMSKAARLQMQLEDLQADHEEQIKVLKKEHDTKINELQEKLNILHSEHTNLNLKLKGGIAGLILLIILYKFIIS